jgi:nicotinamide mononucleotide transporter
MAKNIFNNLIFETTKTISFCLVAYVIIIWGLMQFQLINNFSPYEIVSTFLGIVYVILLRNPNNYLSFIVGIASTLALGLHFLDIDLKYTAYLYFFFFIPCQIVSLITWWKGDQEEDKEPLVPSFLTKKYMAITIAATVIVTAIFAKFFSDGSFFLRIADGFFFSLNVVANILIIKKKTDCWMFWCISNFFAASLFTFKASYFTVALNFVYITVNLIAMTKWAKDVTDKDAGWTEGK